jgi:hypothetical protein
VYKTAIYQTFADDQDGHDELLLLAGQKMREANDFNWD